MCIRDSINAEYGACENKGFKTRQATEMVNVYSFEGMMIAMLLVICSSAYIKRVPKLRSIFLSEKKGFWGVFYKAAVIGTRLHWLVSILCLSFAFHILIFKKILT
eukprot:TRINITY_DN3316_c0_g1_i2.p1 TRINITY_DN3316_c0_g1~~TRINITY_DN3316_c0_g1_i2.p1  ORF type:complete len:105 (+),score=12.17 TRINITY_DN3316_c0_g1_i2:2-316(+)